MEKEHSVRVTCKPPSGCASAAPALSGSAARAGTEESRTVASLAARQCQRPLRPPARAAAAVTGPRCRATVLVSCAPAQGVHPRSHSMSLTDSIIRH